MLHLIVSTLPVRTLVALDIVPLAKVIVRQEEDKRNRDNGNTAGGDEEMAVHACVGSNTALADDTAHFVPAECGNAAVYLAERDAWSRWWACLSHVLKHLALPDYGSNGGADGGGE